MRLVSITANRVCEVEMIKDTWPCTKLRRWTSVPLYRNGCEIGEAMHYYGPVRQASLTSMAVVKAIGGILES